ncbi:MAG: hypothetical protein CI952_67 [Methanohalophilus sp.]|nr:MAG: hypothetical protein CI952_67 [Methanohalophilus sp.]
MIPNLQPERRGCQKPLSLGTRTTEDLKDKLQKKGFSIVETGDNEIIAIVPNTKKKRKNIKKMLIYFFFLFLERGWCISFNKEYIDRNNSYYKLVAKRNDL